MEKIPIGLWIQKYVDLLTENFSHQFRFFSDRISTFMLTLIDGLDFKYPLLFILIFTCCIYFFKRNIVSAIGVFIGFSFILNLGYWRETLETLVLVLFATGLSAGIGVPIGILCAHHPRAYKAIAPILDMMQTIPTFVYLIPTLMLFGLGLAPGVISTVVFTLPAPIRLTYLGVSQVPKSLLEVADVYGSSWFQTLFKIEIPFALPTIKEGISQCMMLSLSMVVIAALVGADGLGKPVIQALNTVNVEMGFEAGLSIVILAVILNKLLNANTKIFKTKNFSEI